MLRFALIHKKDILDDAVIEKLAAEFLNLASEQRLNIILNLYENRFTLSEMAHKLEATVPEAHRNFNRLTESGIVKKSADGKYDLTVFGKILCDQFSHVSFLDSNKGFFLDHDLGDLPRKFVHRIGELGNSDTVTGYIKVKEKWDEIYRNSKKYMCNILFEVSYDKDTVDALQSKLQSGVKIQSIFSDSTIVTKNRKTNLEDFDMQKYIEDETLQRRMTKSNISLVLNESEAGICFPNIGESKPDLSVMFHSDDRDFHEWCLDYFNNVWNDSSSFREDKLKD